MDNDDLFTPTALEELSTLAEKFQADVVHTDKFLCFNNEQKKSATTKELLTMKHLLIKCNPKSKDLTEPTDKPEDLAGRLKLWLNSDFHWTTWALFCRKDFWLTNQISFPQMTVSDDIIANFACLCLAKKLLRVPDITYIYRARADSVSHNAANAAKFFHKWLRNLKDGFNELNKIMGKVPFLDSDDLFTSTALEELAALAENFQADVVHTDTYFLADDKAIDDLIVYRGKKVQHVDAPTLETADLSQRVLRWISRAYNWEGVTMFCRREFLTANQIYFPPLTNNEDMVFSFKLLCLTEKFLRVPNVTYIYRDRTDSVSTKKFAKPAAHFHKWLRVLNVGMRAFDEFTASEKFFADCPEYRAAVSEFFLYEILQAFEDYYTQFPAGTFDELIKREFNAEDAALAVTLFNVVNVYRLQLRQLQVQR